MVNVNNITVSALILFKDDFKLNLQEFALKSYDIEYSPHRFNGAILRFINPSGTCMVFSNGKVNCVGCKNLENAKLVIKKCAKRIYLAFELELLDVPNILNIRLSNYSCSFSLYQKLNLDKISIFFGKNATYDPELFCGLILIFSKKEFSFQCKATIHNSGKVILTGSSQLSDLNIALDFIVDKIFEYYMSED